MSMLIKGMEMPSGCLSCDFCNPFVDEPYCRRLMRRTPKVKRLEDCPLVPVPPHGGLIDKDAMFKDICDGINAMTAIGLAVDGQWMWGKLNDALENAPTIIEAEEGE